MATAAQHRAEIDRINTEVAAQAAKIATVSDVLTEKGSTSNAVGETAATPIAQNTADLDALIARANALPDAGSGGSVETCTLTVSSWSNITYIQAVILIEGNKALYNSVSDGKFNTIEIVKNSIVACRISSPRYSPTAGSNALVVMDASPAFAFYITGDTTITVS